MTLHLLRILCKSHCISQPQAAESFGGTAGIDVIYAGGGDDTINGQAGDDALYGEAGNDTIDGGAGADT
ncbi:MAG: hypothetical protein EXR37_03790, partial [Limnohabitans sp.]|nr:hypothetical protein [Limnohabitans sp.]